MFFWGFCPPVLLELRLCCESFFSLPFSVGTVSLFNTMWSAFWALCHHCQETDVAMWRACGRCPSLLGFLSPWASGYMMWSGTWGSSCGTAQRSMTSGIPSKIFLKIDVWKRWREERSCLGWQNMSDIRHLRVSHIALIVKKLYLEELWRLHLWLWHFERIW